MDINKVDKNRKNCGLWDSNIGIDGTEFKILLEYKIKGKSPVSYEFNGNLDFDVLDKDIKYWIPIYIAFKKYKLFE